MKLFLSILYRYLYITCFVTIGVQALFAQTDYVYMVNSTQPKNLYSLVMNSREYRQLPNSPFLLERFDIDRGPNFQSSVIVADPGPYLYVGRIFPDQIYGYYRHIDGQLQLLPGFPINVPSLSEPDSGRAGLVWMEKHPNLPVFYTVHAFDSVIRAWHIQADGSLLELPNSPMQVAAFYQGLQGLDITQDGRYFYLNTFARGILRGRLDLTNGDLRDFETIYPSDVLGRALILSEDDRYLFTTEAFTNLIQRFRVHDDHLERLLPDFEVDHLITWLWRQKDLIVSGAVNQMAVSAFLIQDDGNLVYGQNSPTYAYSLRLSYAAFSPRGDRVYFASNTYQHAFDIGPQGRLDHIPHSGHPIDGAAHGISVAPEIRGDPYALVLEPPVSDQATYRVLGEPRTPFYLNLNGTCLGPFETNDQGVFISAIPRQPDQQLDLQVYCDGTSLIDRVQTVPTLSAWGLGSFILLIMACTIYLMRKQNLKKTRSQLCLNTRVYFSFY